MSKNELVVRHVEPGAPVRATRAAAWVGWHLFEITGVTVPAVFAVSVSPWWWLVSGVVGAGWTVHEVRVTQSRRQGSVTSGVDGSHQVDSVSVSGPDGASGVDGKRVGGAR